MRAFDRFLFAPPSKGLRGFLAGVGVYLCSVGATFALSSDLAISQFVQDSWHKRDGLSTNTVEHIVQTEDGYLWLGGPSGLFRFDGVRFTPIATNPDSPADRDPISYLAAAPDNSLLVAVNARGVRRIVGTTASVVPTRNTDPNVRSISLGEKGDLYLGTTVGLFHQKEGGNYINLTASQATVRSVANDHKGTLWVSCYGQIDRVSNEVSSVFAEKMNGDVIIVDSHGGIWVGSPDGIVHWHDQTTETLDSKSGLLGDHIMAMREDRNGNIWIGTPRGLTRIRPNFNGVINDSDRFELENVMDIFEDHEGSLWIGTGHGLVRFKEPSVLAWTTREGLLSNTTPSIIATPDDRVLILHNGVPNGMSIVQNGTVTTDTSLADGVSLIAQDQSIWLANTGSLFRFKDGHRENYGKADAVPQRWVSCVAEDREGLILFESGTNRVFRWAPGKLTPYTLKDGTPFAVSIFMASSISQADGTVWMVGYDGIWRLKEGEVTRFTTALGAKEQQKYYDENPPSPAYFHTEVVPELNDYWQLAITEDHKGTVWFGSQRSGLTRLREGKFHSFGIKDGLYSNEIYCVLVDDAGGVWMGGPRGISHVSAQDLDDQASGKIEKVHTDVYSTSAGMKVEECMSMYQPAGAKAKDGTLWFATHFGVVSVRPEKVQRNTVAPPVVIEDIIVDGRAISGGQNTFHIGAGENHIEVHYTALSFIDPEKMRFKYKLEGYDKDWEDAHDRRVAYYTRPPPGTYTFRVIACNNDGVWNNEGASVSLTVAPFFYQTHWFYGLCGLGLVGTLMGGIRVHTRRLYARQNELHRHVEERTAELSKTNVDLRNEVRERQRAEQEVERVYQQLITASHQAGMAEVATDVLHNVGNVLNSVNVATTIIHETVTGSRASSLEKVTALLAEHPTDLAEFLSRDPKGVRLPAYIAEITKCMKDERGVLLKEIDRLRLNVEHIKQIVAMQQSYASTSGVVENLKLLDLVEDALRMSEASFARHKVQVVRDFAPDDRPIAAQRHKILQILVNMLQNAKRACEETERTDARVIVRLHYTEMLACISVEDNGVGIPAENMTKIFNHGFTTRKNGRGFGLHGSILAARTLDGDIKVTSKGVGQGATFTLELPFKPAAS